jgi:BirA family biotin operon repressor/biotin-[acetyl-CoA-carboxylase] ligase
MSGTPAGLVDALAGLGFGHPLRHYPLALTTEALALAWARQEGAPEGALVVADQELSPRGRRGPAWSVFPGQGLYASVVLRPGLPPQGEGLLHLLASLAAAEGLERAAGVATAVKWPDDVTIGGAKVAGVKAEAQLAPGRIDSAVVTFRVNVAVPSESLAEVEGAATSLLVAVGAAPDRWEVLAHILTALQERYDNDVGSLLAAYSARCSTLGRSVRALLLPRGEVTGTAEGVDASGALLIAGRGPVSIATLKRLESA